MIAVCLSAGAVTVTLFINSFTLAWMHSVEKIRWEEEWRIEGHTLHVIRAHIRGSGAGMEPPSDAIFRDGVWTYTPHVSSQKNLTLIHSPFTKEYELCFDAQCYPLSQLLPELSSIDTIVFEACER